jgi:hypothetical protein
MERFSPLPALKMGERTYYANSPKREWVALKREAKNGPMRKAQAELAGGSSSKACVPHDSRFEVQSWHSCAVHVLFSQDLVENQFDQFIVNLKNGHERLMADKNASPAKELAPCFIIENPKHTRNRIKNFDMDKTFKHRDQCAGHICLLTNDKTIPTAESALKEYSAGDRTERDFGELKIGCQLVRENGVAGTAFADAAAEDISEKRTIAGGAEMDAAAENILAKYIKAFEELAK